MIGIGQRIGGGFVHLGPWRLLEVEGRETLPRCLTGLGNPLRPRLTSLLWGAPHRLAIPRTPEGQPLLDLDRMSEAATTDWLFRRSVHWLAQVHTHYEASPGDCSQLRGVAQQLEVLAEARGSDVTKLLAWAVHPRVQIDPAHLTSPEDPRLSVGLLKTVEKVVAALTVGMTPDEQRSQARMFLELALHSKMEVPVLLTVAKCLARSVGMDWEALVRFHRETRSPFETHLHRFLEAEGTAVPFDRYCQYAMFDSPEATYTGPNAHCLIGGPSYGRHLFTTVTAFQQYGGFLARFAWERWCELGRPSLFEIAEQGAGNGTLAEGLLGEVRYLAERETEGWEEFRRALRYHAVEVSPALAKNQRERLAPFGSQVVIHEGSAVDGALPYIAQGFFLSNELVDMFPPVKLVNVEGRLHEISLVSSGGVLQEVLSPLRPETKRYLEAHPIELAHGEDYYLQPGIDRWIQNVERHLGRGWILTIDYGDRREDFRQNRTEFSLPTLKGFASQLGYRQALSWLEEVFPSEVVTGLLLPYRNSPTGMGEAKDLTVHVDFTALQEAATATGGLRTISLERQRDFLEGIARRHQIPVPPGPRSRGKKGTLSWFLGLILYDNPDNSQWGGHQVSLIGKNV